MEVCQDYYGLPPPPVGFGQPLHLYKGNIIELTRADADLQWWEVTQLVFNQTYRMPSVSSPPPTPQQGHTLTLTLTVVSLGFSFREET